ncbi:MAG: hypothetical protein FWH37_05620 [Candidatus Bathyarchaeota archaeon]|nr:hypothetical protein [Candidatus Termiticorpusculum sp.]
MNQFIGIEDLAGNAFIELLRRGKNDSVTVEQLSKYGEKVQQYLSKSKEKVFLLDNENAVDAMEEKYSDFFKVERPNQTDTIIKLKSGISEKDLQICFRAPFPVETMIAFMDEHAVKVLVD